MRKKEEALLSSMKMYMLLFDENKIKMERKSEKLQKEDPVG